MDGLTIVIMLVLFLIAMIFVFSTALLTPYIGKKNLISVVLLGLVVGLVGGAFLLSPIVDDIPSFTRTMVEESTHGSDVIQMDLSTNRNLTKIINDISSITGVEKVEYQGITIKIDQDFESKSQKSSFLTALNSSNGNITNVIDEGDNTFFVSISENGDPQRVLDSIYSVFSAKTYAHLKYTSMQANATVAANNVTKIMSAISNNGAVIHNITGPTEDQINMINKYIPNKANIVILSGVIGVVVAIAGFFIDTLYTFTQNRRKRKARQESSRERIKRKAVPGIEKNKKFNNQKNIPRRNSIDIFDDSFDNSPKQNIGSNKNFKQLTKDDFKEEPKQEEPKSKSRFGGLKGVFKKSSKKSETEKSSKKSSKKSKTEKSQNKKDDVNKKSSNSRKVPKVKPKRRE